jgi:malonyl-CoA O-methyltransferase
MLREVVHDMNDDLLDNPYALAPSDVARVFDAAADSYAEAGVVARVAREELLDRLDVVTLAPAAVLDAGCGDGAALAGLRARYPDAQLLAVDLSAAMVERARRQDAAADCRVGDLHRLDLPTGSVDLVFCNQVLPWCYDSERVLAEFRRVLRPGGLAHFSTLGPDTLIELRRAFARLDDDIHVHYFFDMHDIGDAMTRAGLAEPVMDADRLTLTYADVRSLMRDLKAAGSTNVARARRRGLGGRDRLAALARWYEPARREGRLPATYEVVYGQAWATQLRPQKLLADGNVAVPFENLRNRSR